MKLKIATEDPYTPARHISVPASPVWSHSRLVDGDNQLATGLYATALRKRRDGTLVLSTYSIFDNGKGCCVGDRHCHFANVADMVDVFPRIDSVIPNLSTL